MLLADLAQVPSGGIEALQIFEEFFVQKCYFLNVIKQGLDVVGENDRPGLGNQLAKRDNKNLDKFSGLIKSINTFKIALSFWTYLRSVSISSSRIICLRSWT